MVACQNDKPSINDLVKSLFYRVLGAHQTHRRLTNAKHDRAVSPRSVQSDQLDKQRPRTRIQTRISRRIENLAMELAVASNTDRAFSLCRFSHLLIRKERIGTNRPDRQKLNPNSVTSPITLACRSPARAEYTRATMGDPASMLAPALAMQCNSPPSLTFVPTSTKYDLTHPPSAGFPARTE